MLPPAPVARPAATTLVTPVTLNLEATAARYAAAPAEVAEGELMVLTERAIGAWQLEEAAFWQRVKFRARMLRARARGSEAGSPA